MALTPSPDTYAANVSLLLPFDEDLTDYSATPKTLTAAGGAAVSTTQKKYGRRSLYCDGVGDWITTPAHADFDFAAGDFCIEAWIRWTTTGSDQAVMSYGWTTGQYVPWMLYRAQATGKILFYSSSNGTSWDVSNGAIFTDTLTADTWYHIAVTRSGNTFRIFQDGIQKGTFNSTATLPAGSQTVIIGSGRTNVNPYKGYIDEVRITKAQARYTANFTPPNSFFTIEAAFASITPVPIAVFEGTHPVPIYADFASVTPVPLAIFEATHIQPVTGAFASSTPVPIANVEGYHIPFVAAFSSTTPVPIANVVGIYDFGPALENRPDYFILYRCYLSADGEETIELPLSSWQATLAAADANSYISLQVPSVALHGDAIATRAGGELTIKKGYRSSLTGAEFLETLFSSTMTGITMNEGGNSSTISIESLAAITWPEAKERSISNVTYRRIDPSGKVNLRDPVDILLHPGDTVATDEDSFVVGKLTIYVSVTGEQMEVAEA